MNMSVAPRPDYDPAKVFQGIELMEAKIRFAIDSRANGLVVSCRGSSGIS